MKRCFLQLAIIANCMLAPHSTAFAQELQNRSNHITANILLEIPRYIETSVIKLETLCIVDNSDLSRKAKERNTTKNSFKKIILLNTKSNLTDCDFVYTENKRQARRYLRNKSYKTIITSNYSSFIDEGGALAILDDNGQIGIELNLSTAKQLDITFNPDLLEVSKRVIQ